jgi:LysM repeat protein
MTAGALAPAAAQANFAHVVLPGESLTSIAAADGLSVAQVAAANGLSVDSPVLTGAVVQIPPIGSTDEVAPAAAAAPANFAHVVLPGESLTSIAAADGLSVAQLAAANGLSLDSQILSGSILEIPPIESSVEVAPAARTDGAGASTTSSAGSYTVQLGDTLWAIAARAGLTVPALAAENSIDPGALLIAGTTLTVPGEPASTASAVASGPPYATAERVSSSQIADVAAANGVPASLAAAIGWQESGFNNDFVSGSDARGVMQITPGTWAWLQQTQDVGPPLVPDSALDNVRGGVLFLRYLLNATGGDPALAAAGYFQGLSSVRRYGMFTATQQYVNDVMALRQTFGGP